MSDTIVIQESAQHARAIEVREQLKKLTSALEDSFFDTCDLLLEAHDNQYFLDLGFSTFNNWVEGSNLGMSSREARYYVNIASKALRLNVDRPTMKAIKISKLKEIFSLDPDEHREAMEELLKMAASMSLDQVKAEVRKLKLDAGEEESFFMTIKGPVSAKVVIDMALENAKKQGAFEDDAPNGRLLELVCAEFNSGFTEEPEESLKVDMETGEVIEA